jgi:hypothetical protein
MAFCSVHGRVGKGQIWSLDMIFAMVIFSIAITILAFTWTTISGQVDAAYSGSSVIMPLQAQTVAKNLLSPGYPEGWPSQINLSNKNSWLNVSVGLGSASGGIGNLSSSKIYALMSMADSNYQFTKQELGVAYDYDILIQSGAMNLSIGEPPGVNKAVAIYVQRENVVVDGVPGMLTVLIWTNTPLGTT